MELQKFIENVREQFVDAPEDFGADTHFRELDEWSSLVSLSIIAMIDDEYGVVVKAADLRNSNTVGELFDFVNSKAI